VVERVKLAIVGSRGDAVRLVLAILTVIEASSASVAAITVEVACSAGCPLVCR